MAIAVISYSNAKRDTLPVVLGWSEVSEIISTDSTSRTTASSATQERIFGTVTASGGDVWITIGPDPQAIVPGTGVTGRGWPVLEGETKTFGLRTGDRIAVTDWNP